MVASRRRYSVWKRTGMQCKVTPRDPRRRCLEKFIEPTLLRRAPIQSQKILREKGEAQSIIAGGIIVVE